MRQFGLRHVKSILAVCALLAMPALAGAYPLADKIPAGAIMYAGWEGTDKLGAVYEQSNLKGMVDAMNLQDLMGQAWAKGMKDAEAKGTAEDAKLFGELMTAVLKSPTAFYFESMDFTDGQHPVPNMAVVSQVGKGADDLAKRLQAVMDKKHKETDPPATVKVVGDFLVLTIGAPKDLTPYLNGAADKPLATLAADKAFEEASKQVAADAALTVYVNGEGMVDMMAQGAKNMPQRGPSFEKVSAALGLGAFRHAILTGGFEGKNWSMQAFMELGKDRTGLAAFMDNKPLTADALKMIPKGATWAAVGRFDGARFLGDIRAAAGEMNGQDGLTAVNNGIQQAGNFVGIDIEKDLVANHGDVWALYGNPDAAGNSVMGMTLVNAVKDEKLASQTFETLQDFVNAMVAQRGGANAKQFTAQKKGDLTLNTLDLGKAAPTWAVANGKLIFGVTPAAVESAAGFDGKETLADNEQFQAMAKKLGVEKYSSFGFADLSKTAPEAYTVWTAIVTAANGKAQEGDVKFTMPPLEKIKPYLTQSMDVSWSDAAGFHMKSVEPFPGSAYFGGGTFSLDALILPAMEARRNAAPQQRGPVDNGGK